MKERYYSLDVFRGATVCLMIMVNNPGSWSHLFSPLAHAPWHGLTPTDLVFPFFLFAVGNAMAFVLPRLKEGGNKAFWKKIIRRTLIIFFIGLFLNWYPFVSWQGDDLIFRSWVSAEDPNKGVRIPGILQRIAFCYFFASVIVFYYALSVITLMWALCWWLDKKKIYIKV
ncbi:MAG: DUF5009 domain-containing protein [Chitinophagaceae bacterium]|nr:DUF5009 domain-containing protein [Chitinophagaceae bacterium]